MSLIRYHQNIFDEHDTGAARSQLPSQPGSLPIMGRCAERKYRKSQKHYLKNLGSLNWIMNP